MSYDVEAFPTRRRSALRETLLELYGGHTSRQIPTMIRRTVDQLCDARALISAFRAERDIDKAALAEMRKALEPFSDISGEGDEDYPDAKAVTLKFGRVTDNSLTLGDFRRAARVLAKGEA